MDNNDSWIECTGDWKKPEIGEIVDVFCGTGEQQKCYWDRGAWHIAWDGSKLRGVTHYKQQCPGPKIKRTFVLDEDAIEAIRQASTIIGEAGHIYLSTRLVAVVEAAEKPK